MTWKSKKIGDIITLQRGFDITKKEQQEGPYPVVSSSGIQSFHNSFKVEGPGVVTGRKGSLGKVFFIEEAYWPHDTTLWVKDFQGNDPRFIYYFLQTLQLERFDVGSANPSLNRNHIHSLKVKVPPLPTQRAIASILSAYDDLIENNLRRIRLLEEAAQLIYKEWFVHLRFPGWEEVEVVDGVPEGWEILNMKSVLKLNYGKALKKADRKGGDFPVYGSSGIVGFHNTFLTEAPGIILGRKGNVGSVYWSDQSFFPIDTVYFIESECNLYYIFYYLINQQFLSSDAAVPGLNRNYAYSKPFLKPKQVIIEKFEGQIEPIFTQIGNLKRQNQKLQEARDILLPRLMNGTIDVESIKKLRAVSPE